MNIHSLQTWKFKKLENVAEIIDSLHKSPSYFDYGYPMVRVTDIKKGFLNLTNCRRVNEETFKEFTKKYSPQKGDILLSRVGTYGISSYVQTEEKFCLGQNTVVIKPQINSRYLYFCLQSPLVKNQIEELVVGSTQKTISLKNIKALEIPVPKKNEIEAIARILGTLDDKIELNQQMNRTLEATAKAIFKSWFVDFDPVRALMDGRQPEGMDAETAALFPDGFEDSELGMIPQGWRVAPLPEVIEVNPKRSLSKGQLAPYLDMKNMPTQGHYPDNWFDRSFKSGTKFINGDTLLARITPCLENGKTAFVDFLEDEVVGWGSTEYIIFRPKPPLPLEFGYYLARSEELRMHAIQNMTGTSGRQRTPADCFWQYLMAVPTEEIATKFGDLVKPLTTKIRANSEQSRSLSTLRDTLLPKLMSGEIRVVEAEKMVEDVA